MSIVMNKTRNILNAINVNKLIFIYINKRVMHRQIKKAKKQNN